MAKPRRFLNDPAAAAEVVARFLTANKTPETSYATVRDYCESVDHLPQITGLDGDLKNVQRPWAVKALLRSVPPPARLLEIGGGEPIVSGFLNELGYDVTLIDPYDGFGNGPTVYEKYVECFPQVKIVREYFGPHLRIFSPGSFDAIFSVSVLEHLSEEAAVECFRAMGDFLRPGGASIHCFDFILHGIGHEHDRANARHLLSRQSLLGNRDAGSDFDDVVERVGADVDTFFLSPQGHHHWRAGLPYEEYPFRKVLSLQTIAFRSES